MNLYKLKHDIIMNVHTGINQDIRVHKRTIRHVCAKQIVNRTQTHNLLHTVSRIYPSTTGVLATLFLPYISIIAIIALPG